MGVSIVAMLCDRVSEGNWGAPAYRYTHSIVLYNCLIKQSEAEDGNDERVGGMVFKNLNASKPSEHPPVRGENVKTFRWDHRLQIQILFVAFKRVPLGSNIGSTVV